MDQNTEQHTRPFDKDHAAAGTPYRLRNGREATVLKWDTRNPLYPLAGIYGSEDTCGNWTAAGQFDTRGPTDFDLVMVPLGYIDDKPFYVGDEIEVFSLPDKWEKMAAEPRHKMRHEPEIRWPAPEKQYPVTGMPQDEILSSWYSGNNVLGHQEETRAMYRVANAALRHAIDSGQLVIPTVAQAYEIGRQAATENFPPRFVAYKDSPEGIVAAKQAVRDMAVAEAVRNACRDKFKEKDPGSVYVPYTTAYGWISGVDLASIVAKI